MNVSKVAKPLSSFQLLQAQTRLCFTSFATAARENAPLSFPPLQAEQAAADKTSSAMRTAKK